jgi:3-oxoacyl-[acyl-carrier protein] reductase/(S)-1-phenylethanol dehydrogenase
MGKSHQDRVAVITGAAGGLGQAFAVRMAEEGCHLALTDIRSCKDIAQRVQRLGREVYHESFDLTSPKAIESFGEKVLKRLSHVDILVNNAAFMQICDFESIDLKTFQMYQKVNLDAPLLLCKAFVPGMTERRYGRIVNMTSGSAWSPVPGFLGYITTKMGIIGMTRYLATELGDKGITVNALTPALTRHPGTEDTFPPEFFEMVSQRQAIKRIAVPNDVVGTLVFLTSDDAAFMTGQTIVTDGGHLFL